MASYTGMSNLQNHPHRSGFDIGRKSAFTAKVGELLPVYWDISMPGDKYKFNVEYFTRTQPVETSAYTRLREYFDFYAVPLLDYTITGQDGQLLVTDAESLPIPEFDNIGMEALPMTQIFNSPKASIVNLFNAGYNPRYPVYVRITETDDAIFECAIGQVFEYGLDQIKLL